MELLIGLGMYVVNNAVALVGFIIPPFVDVLNKDVKNDTERFWMSIITCFVVAVLLHFKELQHGSAQEAAMWFGVIFTESQATYNLYFKYSYVREVLTGITEKPKEETEALGETVAK